MKIIPFIISALLILASCSRNVHDARLQHIADIVSDNPEAALDSLSAIDKSRLSESDRHFHDFLSVKGRDKAFIQHTSDSLILDVIRYAEKHQQDGYYTEALYYGGRVYHDLGDYPTALNYYQNVLDKIPENDHSVLKSHNLSQMGELLNTLRLYSQAIPYVEKSIKLDSIRKDSISLIYNLDLLGSIFIHIKEYKHADSIIKRAKEIAKRTSPKDTLQLNISLAALKYDQQDIDSALFFIRHTPLLQDSDNDGMAIAYASLIYRNANMPDSALFFARKLIESPESSNHRIGFRVMFSPELREIISRDTLIRYTQAYWDVMESYLNKNGDRSVLIQNSFYNYQLHQRERIKSEEANVRLRNWLTGTLLIVLLLFFAVLFLRYRNKSHLVRLHEAIHNVATLRHELERSKENKRDIDEHKNDVQEVKESKPILTSNKKTDLKIRLRNELMSLLDDGKQSNAISPGILESDVYGKILLNIKENHIIKDSDIIWSELENVVSEISPDFKKRLNILTGGAIKPLEYHTALLVKCGISPTNIAILVGRSKGAIAYRRENIGVKIFDEKIDLNVIDAIIRLL